MILTVDCDYLHPRFAAAFLIVDGGRAAFIETNTAHSVPKLLAALRSQGLGPESVDHVIVTHVHLDHSGGAQALLEACPNATLLAHPKAAPHLIDPSQLVESARHVYGERRFEELYGRIGPIPAARVRTLEDEERIPFGRGSELRFLHTRGHANHHFCVAYREAGAREVIFTGDSFGLAYPDLQKGKGLFIFPSTSPTGFDPMEAKKSVERIASSGASRAYLTHFGAIDDLSAAREQLLSHLDFSEGLLDEATRSEAESAGTALDELCRRRLDAYYQGVLEKLGMRGDSRAWSLLELDLELNAQGIAYVARKNRQKMKKEKP